MNSKTIKIDGMQCNHCKMTVEKVLNALEGVNKVEVDLQTKTATIELAENIENSTLTSVIEEAGFTVIGIE